ncbi:MAG TPA: hypothetical protein VGG45_00835 [Terracidiphilus sp.]
MNIGSIAGVVGTEQTHSASSPKLVQAAHEFEGQMMKELLEPMMAGDALTGADDDDADLGSG